MSEAAAPWTRRPHKPADEERMTHLVSHLPCRASCPHYVQGLARDWPHRSDNGPPPDIPMVAVDFCFANTESDDDVLTIMAVKEKMSISWCDGVARKSSERVCGGDDHRLS